MGFIVTYIASVDYNPFNLMSFNVNLLIALFITEQLLCIEYFKHTVSTTKIILCVYHQFFTFFATITDHRAIEKYISVLKDHRILQGKPTITDNRIQVII